MGNTLDAPKTEKDSHAYTSSTGLKVGSTGMQGWRLEMEDAHVSVDMPSRPDHMLLAVFDGHAGAGGAKYAADKIIGVIENSFGWKDYVAGGATDIDLLGKTLISAFLEIDRDMRAFQQETYGQDTSGCTAVSAMITPTHIICANAGDSRCVLSTGGVAKPLSFDHKPTNDGERKRIEAAGGFVQYNRVDGDLAVSRALGDFGYKNRPDLSQENQKISCAPDITVHERTPSDDALVLACDGLWDVFSNTEAVDQLLELFQTGERDPVKIAEEMVDLALDKGSKDNISAVVVTLSGCKFGEGSGVEGRREQRRQLEAQRAALPDNNQQEYR